MNKLPQIDNASHKNILIIGYGISGKSAYGFLKKKGHNVYVFDDANLGEIPDKITVVDWEKIDFVVKSPSVPILEHNRHKIIKQAFENNKPVVSTFDIFRLYNPKAKIIAVTGTNGKSTTTALTYHILKEAGFSVCLGGNIGFPYFDLEQTEWYVFEMSSYELASSQYLDFEVACVLNIEPDHMEFHGSFENYAKAKHEALEHAKLRIISYEDKLTMNKYRNADNTLTVSMEYNDDADVYVYERTLRDKNSKELILDLAGILNLRGKHNYQNIGFAYSICNKLGAPTKEILKSIQSFKPLPHRMNIVRKIKNTIFVNDSKATNPSSAATALATFVGYKIYWLVGGRSKKIDPMPYVKNYMAEVRKIYLFGEATDEYEKAFNGVKNTVRCGTMTSALNSAFKDASKEPGPSAILLSPMCASFDQFKDYEHRGEEFVKMANAINQQ
ncbi:MAG: UDP-N-acetylmuramoyl-L-alanine--D-glutamate ligase [Holosporales bacterium]|jgi:UDP-N-acetylmuramoylalanine--D-glutamate ligase|nr:UDP-N-acetylmuramoyl-L-alanine--D-glutamate ligase [Holosporales bacterium]